MSKPHATLIDTLNSRLRAEIVADLKYVIRDLSSLLSSAEAGETLYAQSLQGSTMLALPGKIEVLRAQERIKEMVS
jgi:hypothetical protein